MQSQEYKITSLSPMLLHNGQMIDPLNQYAKEMKRWTKKRAKTDEDQIVMGRIEWFASLYHNGPEDKIKDGEVSVDPEARLVIPATTVEAMIVAGSKKLKLGPAAKAGIIVEDDSPLQYDGPADINKLWAGGKHIHRVAVRVGQARVMRTRPIMREWSANIAVSFDQSVIDEAQVYEILKTAGQQVGIFDWRPRFGRFEVARAA